MTIPTTFEPGTVLHDRYEILRLIGSGGMGQVYAARRLALGDLVAVKRLHADQDTAENRLRFLTEARAAAHIRHPNVIRVFDFAAPHDREPFIVTEYLEGDTLAELISRQGRVAPDTALAWFGQVCAAIEAGHRRGVIHRDIKPANVMVTRTDTGEELVKVLDFGLAHLVDPGDPRISSPEFFMGTCCYMAPEQLMSGANTPAVDVFALGVLLYELITGSLPFGDDNTFAIMERIEAGAFPPADTVVPELAREVAQGIAAALSFDASARPTSPEMLARLAGARAGGTPAHAQVPSRRSRRITGEQPHDDPLERFEGREAELGRLRRAYASAMAGAARVVVVTGADGVGKTRLLLALASWAERQGALVSWGRFHDQRTGIYPALDTFVRMLETRDSTTGGLLSEQLRRSGLELAPGSDRWQAFAAITDAFVAGAAQRPLVLLLDDVQHAHAVDLHLIEHLHRSLSARGTLIIAAARSLGPDQVTGWATQLRDAAAAEWLELASLGEGELRRWLEAAFAGWRPSAKLVRTLTRATSGNPHHLVEVLRRLIDTRTLRRVGERWTCTELDAIELPSSVTNAARARLTELDAALLDLLQHAAIIGDELRFETLQRTLGLAEAAVDPLVERALDREILTEEGVAAGSHYRFASVALRAVLLAGLPVRHKQRLHRRVIAALLSGHDAGTERVSAALAHHYHAVEEWPLALRHGIDAASQALARADHDGAAEAARLASDAAQRAPALVTPAAELELEKIRAACARAAGRFDEAAAALRDVLARTAHSGEQLARVEAMMELAQCHLGSGDLKAATQAMFDAAALADTCGDRQLALLARARGTSYRVRSGDVAGSGAAFDGLVAELRAGDPLSVQATVLLERAWQRLKCGQWDDAFRDAQRAHQLAHGAGQLPLTQRAVATMAAIRCESGDYANALPLEQQSLELARRSSVRRLEAIALANLGEIYYYADQSEPALRHFHQALGMFLDIGDQACEGDCRVNLGRALLAAGDRDGAIEMLERGRQLCARTQRVEYEGIACLELGRALLSRGNYDDARVALDRASDCFDRIDSHLRWRAELLRAQLAQRNGDPATARAHAERGAELVRLQRSRLFGDQLNAFDRETAAVRTLLETLAE